jgi:hypothetical protein
MASASAAAAAKVQDLQWMLHTTAAKQNSGKNRRDMGTP